MGTGRRGRGGGAKSAGPEGETSLRIPLTCPPTCPAPSGGSAEPGMRQGCPTAAALGPCPLLTQHPSPPARMPRWPGRPFSLGNSDSSSWPPRGTSSPRAPGASISAPSLCSRPTLPQNVSWEQEPLCPEPHCALSCTHHLAQFKDGNSQWLPWQRPTVRMETAHSYHGNSQGSLWQPPMVTMAAANGHHGNSQWLLWPGHHSLLARTLSLHLQQP